jgi:cysteine desulfurase / selenocysteine lyase
MSTSEFYGGPPIEAAAPELHDNLSASGGLLDARILARMANEFFGAASGTQQEAGEARLPVTSKDAGPAPPANMAGSVPVPGVHGLPQQATPAIPGAAGAFTPFSFLQDSRPLFVEPTAAAAIQNFLLRSPGEPVPGQTSTVPPPPASAAPGGFDSSAPYEFSFLEEARPLFSYAPAVLPAGLETFPAQPERPAVQLSPDLFDVQTVRRDFPILQEQVNGRPLIWLDNAATTQKPQSVIDRLSYFYAHENSNVHRAAHELAARATDAYEGAREKVRRFVNASSVREIVFVRGATEGINLVAKAWGGRYLQKDDEVVITWLEHHANIVPWQMICSEKQARLRVAPVDDSGQVILEEYEKLLGPRTRIVALAQVSNALGTVTPLAEMIDAAHRHGAKVLVDGAQAVSHMPVDVQALNCDFYVFSGHKMFAPTGIGVVFGRSDVLDAMPPWHGGGNMIEDVTFEKTTYQQAPARFEAGTGNIADAVGLGAAIDYLERIGMDNIGRYEHELLVYATAALQKVPGLRMIGTAADKAGVLSFVLDGVRTEEVSGLLNREGIAVRSGHHCAQPILRRLGVESSVRASLALYNTCEDIDALIAALLRIQTERPGRG